MEIADCIQESYRNLASLDEWQSAEDENEAANSPQQRNTEDESKKRNGVHLITMHGSKGLEYDKVFIPDVNEKIIPIIKRYPRNRSKRNDGSCTLP